MGERPRGELPAGIVTFVFTDVEGSTRLLERVGPDLYHQALEQHRRLLRAAFDRHEGYEIGTEGDSFFVAFIRASDAVAAVAEAQQSLASTAWPDGCKIVVRVGLHTGEPVLSPSGYIGLDVHKAARVMAAAHGGQVILTKSTRDLLPEQFALRDLGLHRLKDLSQPEPLYQLLAPGLRVEFPPPKTLESRPTNLPVVATPLVGRRRELAEVSELLAREENRLLTLTGPGGIGKTRLALQAAADAAESFPDGVFWVPFASIGDPALFGVADAEALSVREDATGSVDDVVRRYLADKQLLLVLDNLEHVAGVARGATAALLGAAPRLKIVTTSREALRIAGERLYDVPPLGLPEPGTRELGDVEAAELFVDRAQAADNRFAIADADIPAIVEIVRRLDGLPLAIELAAARVRALSPTAIAARLDDRLRLLTTGARDGEDRQRTLRATIEWSYDLLLPEEQSLFARLGVFVGGCSIEAAEAVCDARGDLGIDVLDGVASLIDKSLVRRRDDRVQMLETIREFALAQLDDATEDATRSDHLAYFLRAAEAAWAQILAGGELESAGMTLLEEEADNLRAALAFAAGRGDGERQVRLAEAQRWLWLVRGRLAEGRDTFDAAVKADVAPDLHATALYGAALFARHQGDISHAKSQWQAAMEIYRANGNDGETARCSAELGGVAFAEGDLETASRLYEEAAAVFNRVGRHDREAIAISNRAAIAAEAGNLAASVEFAERAIAIQRDIGDTANLSGSILNLASTLIQLGQADRARSALREAIELAQEAGYAFTLAHAIAAAADLAAADGDGRTAATLVGAAEAAFASIGAEVPENERAALERTLGRTGVGEAEALRAEGRRLSVDAALRLAGTLLDR